MNFLLGLLPVMISHVHFGSPELLFPMTRGQRKQKKSRAVRWSGIVDCRESSPFSEFWFLWALIITSATTTWHLLELLNVNEEVGIKGGKKAPESLYLGIYFQFSGCILIKEYWRKKGTKIIATLKVLLVFFYNPLLLLVFQSPKMLLDVLDVFAWIEMIDGA